MEIYKADRTRKRWQLRFTDHQGHARQLSSRTRDRGAALTIGHKIERLLDYRTRGDAVPGDLLQWVHVCHPAIRAHLLAWGVVGGAAAQSGVPIAEQVDEWGDHLRNEKERRPDYAEQSAQRVKRLFAACGVDFYAEIDDGEILRQLREWRREGQRREGQKPIRLSARTCNHYLGKAVQFCKWMARRYRKAGFGNPLAGVALYDEAVLNKDKRHPRRALSLEEQRHIVAHAPGLPKRFKMAGAERAMLYRFVLRTGLRAKEVQALTTWSFRLAAQPATVLILAADSKHAEDDEQPMPADLLAGLRDYLAGRGADAPPWPRLHISSYCKMFRADLADLRSQWIADAPTEACRQEREMSEFLVYVDRRGCYADFHAMRHSFITGLALAGVHPKTAQELARHKQMSTTMKFYTHLQLRNRADALAQLPTLGETANAHRGANRGGG